MTAWSGIYVRDAVYIPTHSVPIPVMRINRQMNASNTFDSHSNISCVNGRCSLCDECHIPGAGGYWISVQHLSGMAGEYCIIPNVCTGSCTGCVLSFFYRASLILASYILCFSLDISTIITLMYHTEQKVQINSMRGSDARYDIIP